MIIVKASSPIITDYGDVIFKQAKLLTPGIYTDNYSKKRVNYNKEILKANAQNWSNPAYVNIDHDMSLLKRIGTVQNQGWKDNSVVADLVLAPVTTAAKDVINLIKKGLATDLSIEALTDEEWDPINKYFNLTDIKFTGVAIVTRGACPDSKII